MMYTSGRAEVFSSFLVGVREPVDQAGKVVGKSGAIPALDARARDSYLRGRSRTRPVDSLPARDNESSRLGLNRRSSRNFACLRRRAEEIVRFINAARAFIFGGLWIWTKRTSTNRFPLYDLRRRDPVRRLPLLDPIDHNQQRFE
jgi:hypothetical protein